MTSKPFSEILDSEFRQACKALLGGEVGPLEDFRPYLEEYMQKPHRFSSHLSGRDVYVSGEHYLPSAKFADFDELDWNKKSGPLGINEIKDVDSIVGALGERLVYCGNIVLGTSRDVERCTNVIDSFFIGDSSMITKSEYALYSSFARNCRHVFGAHDTANTSFAIRVRNIGGPVGLNRIFESFLITASSDIFYSSNLIGCQKCWFSFFQRGKKHLIGNLQLAPAEYAKIESSLREQLRDELSAKKRAFGLFDLLKMPKSSKPPKLKGAAAEGCNPERAKEEVEKAWRSTTSVLLGRELPGIDRYGKWLCSNVDYYNLATERSPVSGEDVYVVKKYWMLEGLPPVFVGMEKEQMASISLKKEELSGNLGEMARNASRIAYLSLYYSENCTNIDAPIVSASATNGYKNIMPVLTKNAGFSFWPRESSNIFGSSCIFSSSFCMNTHHSEGAIRTFEVDTASSSSDLYFCHNVEGVSNGMFCFNAKSMRNAIGNAEYEKGKYASVKKALLEQIAGELEKTKSLRWNIYNIGAGK